MSDMDHDNHNRQRSQQARAMGWFHWCPKVTLKPHPHRIPLSSGSRGWDRFLLLGAPICGTRIFFFLILGSEVNGARWHKHCRLSDSILNHSESILVQSNLCQSGSVWVPFLPGTLAAPLLCLLMFFLTFLSAQTVYALPCPHTGAQHWLLSFFCLVCLLNIHYQHHVGSLATILKLWRVRHHVQSYPTSLLHLHFLSLLQPLKSLLPSFPLNWGSCQFQLLLQRSGPGNSSEQIPCPSWKRGTLMKRTFSKSACLIVLVLQRNYQMVLIWWKNFICICGPFQSTTQIWLWRPFIGVILGKEGQKSKWGGYPASIWTTQWMD